MERELISMAANGATAGKIAARFRTTVDTIQAEGENNWAFDKVANEDANMLSPNARQSRAVTILSFSSSDQRRRLPVSTT